VNHMTSQWLVNDEVHPSVFFPFSVSICSCHGRAATDSLTHWSLFRSPPSSAISSTAIPSQLQPAGSISPSPPAVETAGRRQQRPDLGSGERGRPTSLESTISLSAQRRDSDGARVAIAPEL
uniref:Uncharacterized protein n=1 Tax=Aegilops tauschii subsp. strangulata TaxID=200361 RepID=A0A453SX82_AEGTS